MRDVAGLEPFVMWEIRQARKRFWPRNKPGSNPRAPNNDGSCGVQSRLRGLVTLNSRHDIGYVRLGWVGVSTNILGTY